MRDCLSLSDKAARDFVVSLRSSSASKSSSSSVDSSFRRARSSEIDLRSQ